ncbi:MAG: hypothetical protein FWC73_06815 [Defluviitaleaceae bacterium]|nr:hypothetical protein [Defluviitaleaceae bacterium]
MNKYFLGLDGGSTKTHIVLCNPAKGLLDLYTGGGTNYEAMPGGYTELYQVLKEMLDTLLGRHGLTTADIGRAAFGMAGVDTIKQHEEISKILKNLGFTDFDLDNDCILGIKAATSRGYGIACVSGTGYSVLGIDGNGKQLQIGGMGDMTGDYGGGGYIMTKSTAYIYGQLFKGYQPSLMTDMFMNTFGINDKSDFMESLHVKFFNGDRDAYSLAVNRIIFEAAAAGDTPAKNILIESGTSYGESVMGILMNLDYESAPPEIVLVGSLFQKNPDSVLVTALKDYLNGKFQKPYQLKVLDAPSVLGALLWAIDKNGEGIVPDHMREELSEKLQALTKTYSELIRNQSSLSPKKR